MQAQPDDLTEEIKRLRRCLNDLVSVLALPAMWSGGEPFQIVRTLLDALPGMLHLDIVYARLEDPAGGSPIELARVNQPQSLTGGPQEIGTLLNQCLGNNREKWLPVTRERFGGMDISFVPLRLTLQGELGVIVAGAQRLDFPSQTERLLLSVAANQAAIGLQEARLLSEQTRVARELDGRVAQRTSELAASNEELKHSEARKAAILDSALDCIVTIDHEARITEFNLAAERTFGYRRGEVLGKLLAEVIVPPSLREQHRRGFARYVATGETRVLGKRIEMTAVRADGSEFPVELAITRIPMEGPPSFTGYLRDITERKQSEEKLRRSEAYLAEAQRLSHTGSFGWNVSRGELTWSEETFRIFEFDPTTKPTLDLILQRVHPEDIQAVNQLIERASQDGKDFNYGHRLLMPNGSVKHVRVVAHAEKSESGELEFVGAVMDVTMAKETEVYLRTSAKLAQDLVALRAEVNAALSKPIHMREMLQECAQALVRHFEVAFARIWTLNPKEEVLELQASAGCYTHLDGAHSRIKVGSLKVGLIAREQRHYSTNNVLDDSRIGDKEWARNCGFVSFAGYPLVVDGRTIGVIGMFARHALSDAAIEALASVADAIAQGLERKRKEDELRKAQTKLSHVSRLTTVGELTASIAHEVNQPIAAVVTNANACLRWLNHEPPNFEEVRIAIERIIRDGDRGGEVIKRIRALVRKEHSHRAWLDVNEAVRETIALAGLDLRGTVLRTELSGELPHVQADRVQLQQVLLNLIINAMDAMKPVQERPHELRIHTKYHQKNAVLVAVEDSGVGLNPEGMEKLFETFYTTKPEGLGLGLSICRAIIEGHGGRLWGEPNDVFGARFQFTLPIERESAA